MSDPESVSSEPARRFVIAQSWWIASELARRHPHLRILETHPGGGMYDCLTLLDRANPGGGSVISLNRNGGMHVHAAIGLSSLSWTAAMSARGGHDVVRELEARARLVAPSPAPPTGAEVLTYRVVARVLTSLVDDRHAWDARSGQIDSSGYGAGRRAELEAFPSVVEALREERPDDPFGMPAYRFWILMRDADPVVVLDTDGRVHRPDGQPVALLPIYRGAARSLTATIGTVLGPLLP